MVNRIESDVMIYIVTIYGIYIFDLNDLYKTICMTNAIYVTGEKNKSSSLLSSVGVVDVSVGTNSLFRQPFSNSSIL